MTTFSAAVLVGLEPHASTHGALAAWVWGVPSLFSEKYLPHKFCYLAQPELIWTNVAMDGLIAAAYLTIFLCLMWMAGRLKERAEFRSYVWIFLAFGMFILACAGTHVMEVVTVWWPYYPLSAGVKVVCAVASVGTAVLFARATPVLAKNLGHFLQMLSATEQERDEAVSSLKLWQQIVEERQKSANEIEAVYTQLQAALECTSDMVMTVGFDWTILYANGRAQASLPALKVGKNYWDCFPGLEGTIVEAGLRHAMKERGERHWENYYEPYDRWFRVQAYPSKEGVSVFFSDMSGEAALKAQLREEQEVREKRIEVLSHMAGGMAHEISNPLAIIHAQASDLRELASKAHVAKLATVAAEAIAAQAELRTHTVMAEAALTTRATAARGTLAREATTALAVLAAEAGTADAAVEMAAGIAETAVVGWDAAGALEAGVREALARETLAVGAVAAKAALTVHAAKAREAMAESVKAALSTLADEASAAQTALAGAASVAEVSLATRAKLVAERAARGADAAAISAESVLEVCESIVNTSDRAIRILRGLRGFSREASQDPMEWASINDIIDQALEMQVSRYARHDVKLTVTMEETLPLLLCRETQIGQVVTNLLNNAFDAIDQANSVERWVVLEAKNCEGEVCVEVTDSGPGVPKELRARLMEPFFTTKKMGLGMGVGLSLSRVIAKDHGGSLDLLEGTEHTCFRLKLPVGSESSIR